MYLSQYLVNFYFFYFHVEYATKIKSVAPHIIRFQKTELCGLLRAGYPQLIMLWKATTLILLAHPSESQAHSARFEQSIHLYKKGDMNNSALSMSLCNKMFEKNKRKIMHPVGIVYETLRNGSPRKKSRKVPATCTCATPLQSSDFKLTCQVDDDGRKICPIRLKSIPNNKLHFLFTLVGAISVSIS